MTGTERTDLMEALAELSRRYPHWRFGQLVSNIAGWADADIWDAEDSQLLAAASAHLDAIQSRKPDPQLVEEAGTR
jgi:hypothetical protein